MHVIDSGGLYGAEMMLLSLVQEQLAQGLDPVIASIGSHGSYEKPLEAEARKRGLPLEIFRMRPGLNFSGAKQILDYACRSHCHILHSHGYKGNILLGLLPKFIRNQLPLIATVHGWTLTGTGISKMRLYEWMDRIALRRVDVAVVVNEGMLGHPFFSQKALANTRVVNNGISPNPPLAVNDSAIIPDSSFKLVAVGRLSPEKGFEILLQAVNKIIQHGHNLSLVIFGEGKERERLESIIKDLQLCEKVTLAGFRKNVAETFGFFDLLVISSLTEGLPITLLEAMRARLPVIATKVGGIPNVLQDGLAGVLVDPGNDDALVASIEDYIAHGKKDHSDLVNAASCCFHKKYTAEKMAMSYLEIYRSALC